MSYQKKIPDTRQERISFRQSLREHISPVCEVSNIAVNPDLVEMQSIVRNVYLKICSYNPFVLNIPAELINEIISNESRSFLKVFGLEICRYVANQIINLEITLTNKSTLGDFTELCKSRKRRLEADKGMQHMLDITTVDTSVNPKPKGYLKSKLTEILRGMNVTGCNNEPKDF
jgi:hypothetical protein